MKYARAVVEKQAPGLPALEPRADADVGRIGLAWITSKVSEQTLTWHNGSTGGNRSMLAMDRATGQAVVVLNSSTRSVDDSGLQLAGAGSDAELQPTALPGLHLGQILAFLIGLVLLVPGVVALLRRRHRIAAIRGAIHAAAALVLLRAHGPWALLPAELWSALLGLVLASVLVGFRHFKTSPAGPKRHRWASITSVGLAMLVLLVLVWTG